MHWFNCAGINRDRTFSQDYLRNNGHEVIDTNLTGRVQLQ